MQITIQTHLISFLIMFYVLISRRDIETLLLGGKNRLLSVLSYSKDHDLAYGRRIQV